MTQTILVVDANPVVRSAVVRTLVPTGCRVLEAADGERAIEIIRQGRVRLVVSELFLRTGESNCLVQAVRQNRMRGTRVLAHTRHRSTSHRDWARQWGASGFVVQPAAPERLQYVVGRLLELSPAGRRTVKTARRETLGGALDEIERGELAGMSRIVVGRSWWAGLSGPGRNDYRRRARRSGISLRSDALMSPHFVEIRGAPSARSG